MCTIFPLPYSLHSEHALLVGGSPLLPLLLAASVGCSLPFGSPSPPRTLLPARCVHMLLGRKPPPLYHILAVRGAPLSLLPAACKGRMLSVRGILPHVLAARG